MTQAPDDRQPPLMITTAASTGSLLENYGLWFEGRVLSRSTLHRAICAYQRCLCRGYLVEEKNAGSS